MSNVERRKRQVLDELLSIRQACDDDKKCPFRNLKLEDGCVSFEYQSENRRIFYSIYVTDDYPELYHEMRIVCTNSSSPAVNISPSPTRRATTSSRQRSRSPARDLSDDSSDNSDDDDYFGTDYDDNYDGDHMTTDNADINPQLVADIQEVLEWPGFGPKYIEYSSHPNIDDCCVELSIFTDHLTEDVANAWLLDRTKPIVVQLHFSLIHYLNSGSPSVDVFQRQCPVKTGVVCQLQKIMETYVSQLFRDINDLERRRARDLKPSTASLTAPRNSSSNTGISTKVDADSFAQLVDLGYSVEAVRDALAACSGEMLAAADLLVSSSSSSPSILQSSIKNKFNGSAPPLPDRRKAPILQPSKLQTNPSLGTPARPSGSKTSTCSGGSGKTKTSRPLPPIPGSSGESVGGGGSKKSSFLSGWFSSSTNENASCQCGLIFQVLKNCRLRLETVNEHCVVCDERHQFQSMLKPTVCSKELCVFAFQTLGVMSTAADSIATSPEVIDLLVAMATAAATSSRRNNIFVPYPSVVNPSKPDTLALNPDQKDFDKVQQTLAKMLRVEQMSRLDGAALKTALDASDPLCYPLLQWIIASNRSHIVKLPARKLLKFMQTPHQYLLRSSPPAKEQAFVAARLLHGSVFAFHGSSIENWHSIMRRGLLNASGTSLQVNGAAYGSGIYLSPTSAMSFGYSRMNVPYMNAPNQGQSKTGDHTFLRSKNITCIALCEVIQGPELQKKVGNIWVMKNPDYVCTRFFFVYEDGKLGDALSTEDKNIIAQIKEAIALG